jgi:hypothetical protein
MEDAEKIYKDQNITPSDQPEHPTTSNQTGSPFSSPKAVKPTTKFTKKTKIISTVIVILLILIGLVVYELKLASNFETSYMQYTSSLSYAYYAEDMRAFLQNNNGVFSKMYNCSATASMVWNDSNSTGSADFQYTNLQNKIRTDLQIAQKAQPAYRAFILASILPQARRANNEHADLNNLFSSTSGMMGNNIASYCVNRLYGPIIALQPILKNPNTGNELRQTIVSEVQYVTKLKDNVSPHVSVPSGMAPAENIFDNDFLTKLAIDLNSWIALKDSSAQTGLGFDGLNTTFAQDTNELSTVVIPKATLQAENIKPSTAQLQTLLNNVSKNH